jgi:hypothetical protein
MNVNDWVGKLGSMFQQRGLQHVEERRFSEYKTEMWKYWAQLQTVSCSPCPTLVKNWRAVSTKSPYIYPNTVSKTLFLTVSCE